ncbi:hypothetical protein NE236_15750 [Actinoallomurus purpureus]|uniref:hypothetical protein n=1 Tax=Actinoallomurus purpureus TaxID=478114 RepID=UPI0020931402|nr:hypothetical protein [Actinoallomurus purpureus]MCO6006439.1 hypothetical protein [Actinoallomurus purpureus]
MGLADLDSVDLVTGPPGGDQALWLVADDWAPEREALDYVQLMIKVAGALAHAERISGEGRRSTVLVHSTGEPPVSVLQFLWDRDIAATIGSPLRPRPATGRPARHPNLPDGSPDLETLQGANAARLTAGHGLDGSVESLVLLDDALEERRRLHGLRPDDEDDTFTDGELLVPAGAYAGEVLRRHTRDAAWWFGPPGRSGPLHLRAGLGHGTRVDVLGRVQAYLRRGSTESVHDLISTLLTRLNA